MSDRAGTFRRSTAGQTKGPAITLSETGGVRYLHFGTEWVQGAMRVRKPWDLELDYSRHMMAWLLFKEPPLDVLQLGLGVGALTRFVYRYMPQARVTVVELSGAVVAVARSQFRLPADDDRLEVVIEDAAEYVTHPRRRAVCDVLQVDVFDGDCKGPVLDSLAFYSGCRRVLRTDGIMVVNLFGEVPSYGLNLQRISQAFDGQVLVLPPIEAGNIIVLAFAGPLPTLDWANVYARAEIVQTQYGLNASGWVNGLKDVEAKRLAARS